MSPDAQPPRIALGRPRVVMRGPMFPSMLRVGAGSIVLAAASSEEHSEARSIRSDDLGETWRPVAVGLPTLARPSAIQLADGRALATAYLTEPIDGEPGWYRTRRWESDDDWRTLRGPHTDGRLYLPPDRFDPARVQWFHGNTIEMPDGELLAAMQGRDAGNDFRTYLAASDDRGVTWHFVAEIASLGTIEDPDGATRRGWTLHGPCEPAVAHLGQGRLICVARLVDDDRDPPMAEPTETYRDLNDTIAGDDVYRSGRPADRYYTLGPPSAPLIASFSDDRGRSWTPARPMAAARGCQPRLARVEGALLLTYGAIAFPRWGNFATASADGGRSWSEPVCTGPCLTTGYTDVVPLGGRRALGAFDCAPPQPWRHHAAHWVGVVDLEVATG